MWLFLPYHSVWNSSLRRASVTALSSIITLVAWISRGKRRRCVHLHFYRTEGHTILKSFLRAVKNVCCFRAQRIYVFINVFVWYICINQTKERHFVSYHRFSIDFNLLFLQKNILHRYAKFEGNISLKICVASCWPCIYEDKKFAAKTFSCLITHFFEGQTIHIWYSWILSYISSIYTNYELFIFQLDPNLSHS